MSLEEESKEPAAAPAPALIISLFGEETLLIDSADLELFSRRSTYFRLLAQAFERVDLVAPHHLSFDTNLFIFSFLLRYLGGQEPTMTSDLDVLAVSQLASALALDTDRYTLVDSDGYNAVLLEKDALLRQQEQALRRELFSHEEGNYAHVDEDHEFSRVCARNGYRLLVGEPEEPVALTHAPLENEQGYFWGRFGAPKTRVKNGLEVRAPAGRLFDGRPDEDYAVRQGADYPVIGQPRPFDTVTERYREAQRLFAEATGNTFVGFDFGSLVVAGGSLFSVMTGYSDRNPVVKRYLNDNDDLDRGLRLNINDIDLFLVTKDPIHAEAEIDRLVEHLRSRREPHLVGNDEPLVVRTQHTVSIAIHHSIKVQVVLRLYNSVTQVMAGFDLDSATVAYDGRRFYCMDRFVRVLQRGYNLVDPDRQSTSYGYRLVKYLRRDVCLAIPGYDRARVTPTASLLAQPTGLARLLQLYQRVIVNVGELVVEGERRALQEPGAFTPERFEESDYAVVFPNDTQADTVTWSLNRIANKASSLPVSSTDILTQVGAHDVDRETVIRLSRYLFERNASVPYRIYVDDQLLPAHSPVPDRIAFLTRNPGQQTTNSFKPTNEEWFRDLYVVELDQGRYRQDLRLW